MKKHFTFFLCNIALFFFCTVLQGNEILVHTEVEEFLLDVNPEDSLESVKEKVDALSSGKARHFLLEFAARGSPRCHGLKMSRNQGGYLGYPRNYFLDVTDDEKACIRFIVTTLANKSLIAIAIAKNEIEEAGDRIDHLHPLRFLMTIFTDEELKAGIRNIRGRGWIWNHFTGGLKDSLATEMSIDNLKEIEHIGHFSQTLNIHPSVILPSIRLQKWDDFIDLLITHIPRSGNHDRYDT